LVPSLALCCPVTSNDTCDSPLRIEKLVSAHSFPTFLVPDHGPGAGVVREGGGGAVHPLASQHCQVHWREGVFVCLFAVSLVLCQCLFCVFLIGCFVLSYLTVIVAVHSSRSISPHGMDGARFHVKGPLLSLSLLSLSLLPLSQLVLDPSHEITWSRCVCCRFAAFYAVTTPALVSLSLFSLYLLPFPICALVLFLLAVLQFLTLSRFASRRRMSWSRDIALGIRYLHGLKPKIIHRCAPSWLA